MILNVSFSQLYKDECNPFFHSICAVVTPPTPVLCESFVVDVHTWKKLIRDLVMQICVYMAKKESLAERNVAEETRLSNPTH